MTTKKRKVTALSKKLCAMLIAGILLVSLTACTGSGNSGKSGDSESAGNTGKSTGFQSAGNAGDALNSEEKSSEEAAAGETSDVAAGQITDTNDNPVELQVFIAASLSTVMEDLAGKYNETHPDVKITYNADSSGTLMTQIEEGYACDVFFSAAQKQMDQLADEGFVVEETRSNVVNNQLVVLTQKDSDTEVTGLEDLNKAKSIALADGSVPVGKYTRQALMNLGTLPEVEDPSLITTKEVSDALGGVEISEQANVSKVLLAVVEGSCEVGTTYYSDTYGYEDQVNILQTVSYDLSGNIIYPIAQINNEEADDAEKAAAKEFIDYITSDEAKAVFDQYYFDTDVE